MYLILGFLILVAFGFLVAGIGVVVLARHFDRWIWNKFTWPAYRKLAQVFRMTEEEWAETMGPFSSLSFRLWFTRVWGGMIAVIAFLVLSALIYAWATGI